PAPSSLYCNDSATTAISTLSLHDALPICLPDDQLLTLASQGKLKDPAVLERQVRRMLADTRSEALATNFAYQWLHLQSSSPALRSEEHTSELQSGFDIVCRLLLEKKKHKK